MKKYELIIERSQPPCGGKPPKVFDFKEVETDDPNAYVQMHEKDSNLSTVTKNGSITIIAEKSAYHVEYQFTEI